MFLAASIGLLLPFALIGLGLCAVYAFWLTLNGFSVAWGIATTLFCLWYMFMAYRMMVFLNGRDGVQTNATAAGCLPSVVELTAAAYFLNSSWSSQLSPLWALLLPVTLILHLAMQGLFEWLLDLINPSAKRQ